MKTLLKIILLAHFTASCTPENRKENGGIDSNITHSQNIDKKWTPSDSILEPSKIQTIDENTRRPDETVPIQNFDAIKNWESLKPKSQKFKISNQRDTIISGKQGTQIRIQAGSFSAIGTSMKANSPVEFSMTEYYKPSDILLAGLTTQSGKSILETGGMIHLSAQSGKQALKLNKNLEVKFSSAQSKKENQIYYGVNKGGQIDWEVATKKDNLNRSGSRIGINQPNSDWLPKFKGDLDEYMDENLFYPPSLAGSIKSGLLYVSFEVTNLGTIKSVELQGSIDPLVDKVVWYFVANMPNWKPALSGTKPIRSFYRLPVNMGRSRAAKSASEIEKAIALEKSAGEIKVVYDALGAVKYASRSANNYQINNDTSSPDYELDGVTYSISKLGWVNCDRLFNSNKPLARYVVDRKGMENFNYFLYFTNLKVAIGPQYIKDQAVFFNVPNPENCILIGYDVNRKSARMFTEKVTPSAQVFHPTLPKEITLQEMKTKLENLNQIWN